MLGVAPFDFGNLLQVHLYRAVGDGGRDKNRWKRPRCAVLIDLVVGAELVNFYRGGQQRAVGFGERRKAYRAGGPRGSGPENGSHVQVPLSAASNRGF